MFIPEREVRYLAMGEASRLTLTPSFYCSLPEQIVPWICRGCRGNTPSWIWAQTFLLLGLDLLQSKSS